MRLKFDKLLLSDWHQFGNVEISLNERMTILTGVSSNSHKYRTLATIRDLILRKLISDEVTLKQSEKTIGEVT